MYLHSPSGRREGVMYGNTEWSICEGIKENVHLLDGMKKADRKRQQAAHYVE